MRACINRGLTAGASNDGTNRSRVTFTIEGANDKIDEIVNYMKTGKPLNSWGARVDRVIELDKGLSIDEHQVTTKNVDQFNWKKNVEFYI